MTIKTKSNPTAPSAEYLVEAVLLQKEDWMKPCEIRKVLASKKHFLSKRAVSDALCSLYSQNRAHYLGSLDWFKSKQIEGGKE